MDTMSEVKVILGSVLNLDGRLAVFDADTALLGSVAELDSMAVVNVITALEEYFGVEFDDEEITAEMFETVGTLTAAVEAKL